MFKYIALVTATGGLSGFGYIRPDKDPNRKYLHWYLRIGQNVKISFSN